MKKILQFAALPLLFFGVLSSCSQKFLMVSEGENFDSLTKITDSKEPCIYPHGGDENKKIVFAKQEDNGTINIYMKENVLTSAIIQKTEGDNVNLSPNYCLLTGNIAFQYFDKTNFDIYYVNANKGKAITQVTNTDENEYNPAWSPDGKMIAFERGSSPRYYVTTNKSKSIIYKAIVVTQNQIWIKNIETGELKMLGPGSFPRFSPDGKEISYVKYQLNKKRSAETGTIWTMTIDGENQKQLTTAELGYATWPNWSPDGKSIIFQLTKNNKKDSDIYSISAEGENLKQYTTNLSQDFAPYWSKDGLIYFSSDRGSNARKYQIWRFKI